jgi:hypothetical protein
MRFTLLFCRLLKGMSTNVMAAFAGCPKDEEALRQEAALIA